MTNIQSKAFYKEAEDMQKGWGKRLRHIDELKDKVKDMRSIGLNDACYILYGEGYDWAGFDKWAIKNEFSRKRMVWEGWKELFSRYVKS